MWTWIEEFISSTRETKWFLLNWFIYGFLIVVTFLYCYLRLDYVRSYKTTKTIEESKT